MRANSVNNASNIQVSEDTKKLLVVKARISELYNDFAGLVAEIEPIESQSARQVKEALLDTSNALMMYLLDRIDENTLSSDYKEM